VTDKPNIRLVLHFSIPRGVIAWYQEIGRAGRDGLQSKAILFFNDSDISLQSQLIHSDQRIANAKPVEQVCIWPY
jgi:ATP-dependent DNA helicase RecQ